MITKTIKINPSYPNLRDIEYVTDVIRSGGINSISTIKKIDLIKGREKNKPYSLAFSDMDMVKKYVVMDKDREIFIRKHIKEPYTFILEKRKNVPDFVTKGSYGVGVRIPNHNVCRLLVKYYGSPIVSTSANVSGKYPPTNMPVIMLRIGTA